MLSNTSAMNSTQNKPIGGPYSAYNSLRPTNFYCNAPHAQSVELVGDFNNWFSARMHRRVDGWWYVQVLLCHGHHRYRFLVDGQPVLDPTATGTSRDEGGEPASLIAVS